MDPRVSPLDRSRPAPHNPPGTRYATYDPGGTAKPSTTVVHALADVIGRDVTDVGFFLHDSIDPDALDALLASTTDMEPPGHVAFSVPGYGVTVYSDGHIVITPLDQHAQ